MIFDSGDTGDVGGYTIANSLRFRSGAVGRIARTFTSAGDQQKWTFSIWFKRGDLATDGQMLFGGRNTGWLGMAFNADRMDFYQYNSAYQMRLLTTAVYRDPSAWYHVVFAIDTTQATAANRARIYVNGVEVTAFTIATYPTQNTSLLFNASGCAHYIGAYETINPFDGYVAHPRLIGGSQLDASSFGQFNTDGVWVPKSYTGSYAGANSTFLDFSDGSNLTNLCLDRSGNGNNWTASNVSLSLDWMVDSPTCNYAVLTPLNTSNALSNGNLTTGVGSGSAFDSFSTIGVSSGKWYWETTQNSVAALAQNGIAALVYNAGRTISSGDLYVSYGSDGNKYVNGAAGAAYGATYTTNDVIGVALDCDGSTVTFYKNNVSQGAISITSGAVYGLFFRQSNSGISANFGQRPFAYTPPTGFKALCTANLPAVTVTNGRKNFDVDLYTGSGVARNRTGFQFQPDLVWNKSRSVASSNHEIYDSVRGATKFLSSNTTNAEATLAQAVTAFNSDGYSLGDGTSSNANTNGATMVSWLWKAGGAAVTNTAGSITSQVSANTAAGFSIVTFTGNAVSGATVGHGLPVPPSLILLFSRSVGQTHPVYHAALGNTTCLRLETTGAKDAASATIWNNTSPTSSVFSLGNWAGTNGSGTTFVALCFSDVPGYSKAFSLLSNASADGPMANLGFSPAFILYKCADTSGTNWVLYEAVRNTYNVVTNWLLPNGSNAEQTTGAIDLLANGFKLRSGIAGASDLNGTAGTQYVGIAFARNPFGGSNVAPATAR